jgi:hypothetical protein
MAGVTANSFLIIDPGGSHSAEIETVDGYDVAVQDIESIQFVAGITYGIFKSEADAMRAIARDSAKGELDRISRVGEVRSEAAKIRQN